ncbi:bifunctional acetate--CoA ligase family protein/GNAT family N-acetyltransferase [Streptomyces sp. GS7]|uniref:bifunctional acetate--CoA ligase family protein/GNAT family N-acetyltransferase n=1 Tax=Streptomyces sp. GS7 TaxID=2692234 RepID=UPI0013172F2F|nr:bifunctional GNAT family N-acetyltransferase/acetate--CoA ligase family protein [Streptomyces sp. GS7]QHC22747.1 GNAT family N-acetyltransferase [Streptomyces sp. GS7]
MTETTFARNEVCALLADGSTVRLRPACPEDRAQVLRFYGEMSADSLRRRFFVVSRRSGERAADRLCVPDTPGHRTLAAFQGDRLVGVAEYETGDAPTTADIALAVADDCHRRGVGTLLLEHLVHTARENGVTAFTADLLADNHPIHRVLADLGLRVTRRYEGTTVHGVIRLEPDERYLSAVDLRGRTADTASLRPLLRPRSVAVVGAGTRPGSVGRAVLRNLRGGHFRGLLHAVNPHAHAVLHVPAFSSVGDLPAPPDLAVIAVPAAGVPGVAAQCGRAGVKTLVVVTAGLDADRTAELTAACRRWGMRMVGPNCLGIANTEPGVRLDATFAVGRPLPGTAGVAVQSGGVGIALLDGLSRLGIGVSSFVSLGDKRDVSGNDLLQWWECDERTELALLHLESFGNPRAFSRTARRVTRRMPVLTVDAGRSAAGRRAAASYTAAAPTPTTTRRALFTQAGITAAHTLGELLDTAALLHSQPLPAGERVAVISNAGGAGVLAADACADAELHVPQLPPALRAELLAELPAGAGAGNPVDSTPAVTAPALSACVDRIAASGAVDAILVALVPTALTGAVGSDLVTALTSSRHPAHAHCPVVAVLLDQPERVRLLRTAGGPAVPAYGEPQSAARALKHAAERARWLARPQGSPVEPAGIDSAQARALVAEFLTRDPAGGWLDARQAARLLDCYGIPRLPQAYVTTEHEAAEAAARLADRSGAVALKAQGPGLVHRTERGGVLLDLHGERAVRTAYRDLAARLGTAMAGALVQPMAGRGTELLAGVVQDEVFGALVVFGLGGTTSELPADHAARLAPLTDTDVHELLTAPRCAPLLFGYRGAAPADLRSLKDLLARLSRMADDLPELAEAECNPVVVRPDGSTVVGSRVRLLPRRAADPYLRRLP